MKTDGTMYRVQRFAVRDSTVILEEVSGAFLYDGARYPPGFRKADIKLEPPIIIPFREIKSIERVGISETRTTLAAVGILAVLTLVATMIFFAYG